MNREEIVQVLKNKFSNVYCDSCAGNADFSGDYCDFCHRKYMNWGISDEYAELVADEIMIGVNDEFI